MTVGGTFALGKRDKAVHVNHEGDYLRRLRSLGNKFVVLHDTEVRRAWLVDGISALLHAVRANLFYNYGEEDYRTARTLTPESLKAQGQHGGRKMAFDTLTHPENMKLRLHKKLDSGDEVETEEKDSNFYCLVDAVKFMMHLLEQIFDHQADERAESSVGYRIRLSPSTQLEGFDFMDIATESDLIWPRATTLHSDGESWVKLTRAVNAITLFGRGFGDLLEPVCGSQVESRCEKCSWNSGVPLQRDILAVCVCDLERIVERRGRKADGHWRLVNDLYLDVPRDLFLPCSRHGHRGCQQRRVQEIHCLTSGDRSVGSQKQERQPGLWSRMFPKTSRNRNGGSSPPIHQVAIDISAGGILLGTVQRRLQKSVAAPTDMRQRVELQREEGQVQVHLQAVASASSSRTTQQDGSTVGQSNSNSTSLTEQSITRSLASAVALSPRHAERNLRFLNKRKASKGKEPDPFSG